MKNSFVLIGRAMLRGLLIIVPIYLAVLLVLKGMKSLSGLVKPFCPPPPGLVSGRGGPISSPGDDDLRPRWCCRSDSDRTRGP